MGRDIELNTPYQNAQANYWVRIVQIPWVVQGDPVPHTGYQVERSDSRDGPWERQHASYLRHHAEEKIRQYRTHGERGSELQ
jgi:hypothetical protein